MLFLLRKIRRKLMQKNKFTTYLLYAVGEIILVVIGILIAVSINNASQQRKDQEVVKKYLVTLVEELEANVTTLANDISYSQSRLDTLHTLKQSMAKPSATLDSLVSIARYHFDYGYDPDVYLNNITFNTLENTGDIKLLDEKLRDSLYYYQSELIKWSNVIKHNTDFYVEIDIAYHQVYPASGDEQFLGEEMMDALWSSIDQDDFALRFNSLVSNKIIAFSYVIRYQKLILWRVQNLLNFLKLEYPNALSPPKHTTQTHAEE